MLIENKKYIKQASKPFWIPYSNCLLILYIIRSCNKLLLEYSTQWNRKENYYNYGILGTLFTVCLLTTALITSSLKE